MENTEDSEATPLLQGRSGRGRSSQLICLMICAVGCIVTTGMVLRLAPRSRHGGGGGTLEGREAESQNLTLPVEWKESEDYRKARQFVRTLKVVNDAAERGTKLASDYAQYLAKDSEMKQMIFQTLEWHRREMADIRKSTVNK